MGRLNESPVFTFMVMLGSVSHLLKRRIINTVLANSKSQNRLGFKICESIHNIQVKKSHTVKLSYTELSKQLQQITYRLYGYNTC